MAIRHSVSLHLLPSLLAAALLAGALPACRSGGSPGTAHTLVILLEEGADERFFEQHYGKYQPVRVRLANRTLNEYRVTWNCRARPFRKLLRALKADVRVLKITPPTPTKNQAGNRSDTP